MGGLVAKAGFAFTFPAYAMLMTLINSLSLIVKPPYS